MTEIKIIGSLKEILFDKKSLSDENYYQVNIDGFKISKDELVLKGIDDPMFRRIIGFNGASDLYRNPFIFQVGEVNILLNHTKSWNEGELISKYKTFLETVIFSLWFIKDSCVTLEKVYYNIGNKVIIQAGFKGYYDSKGKKQKVSFSDGEMFEFEGVWQYVLHYLKGTFFNPMAEDIGRNNSAPYKHLNRLQRALLFLFDARETNVLPKRVTFHIALLESLFTTSSTELTHKVSERTACFLGGSIDEKLKNYETVKEAYKVRSRYMHGDQITQNLLDLESVSKNIENLVRVLLKKIMMEGYRIFTDLKETDSEKKRFEKYFENLVLGRILEDEEIYKPKHVFSIQTVSIVPKKD